MAPRLCVAHEGHTLQECLERALADMHRQQQEQEALQALKDMCSRPHEYPCCEHCTVSPGVLHIRCPAQDRHCAPCHRCIDELRLTHGEQAS